MTADPTPATEPVPDRMSRDPEPPIDAIAAELVGVESALDQARERLRKVFPLLSARSLPVGRTVTAETLAEAIMLAHDRKRIDGRIPFSVQQEAEAILASLPVGDDAPSLDAAWKAAEDALPDGGKTTLLVTTLPTAFGGAVKAEAFAHPANRNYERLAVGSGDSPAAALLDLAARLAPR